MNVLQLNADIYNSLSVISLDEGLLKRAATYLKKIAQKKKDETLMTKEEYFAKIDRAMKQAERGEGREFSSKEEMNAWLNSL